MARLRFALSDLAQGVLAPLDQSHTLTVVPNPICARLLGSFFETNKDFILPGTLGVLREVKRLYDAFPNAALLIVGHTDTTGTPELNDPLSLRRAESVHAYLTDDVSAWQGRYAASVPQKERWGTHEDELMLLWAKGFAARPPDKDPVLWFQETRSLEPDGICGPKTREKLIGEYMAQDGTTLPKGVEVTVHGCGENFPLDEFAVDTENPAPDDKKDAVDRRVELFFFDRDAGIEPPPPGKNSPPGSTAYPEWLRKSREQRFTAGKLVDFHVKLRRPDESVLGAEAYELIVNDQVIFVGVSGKDGEIQHVLDADLSTIGVKLTRLDRRLNFGLGALKPLGEGDGVAGAQGRLLNLGFGLAGVSGKEDEATREALLAVQRDAELPPTGSLDLATKAEIARRYES